MIGSRPMRNSKGRGQLDYALITCYASSSSSSRCYHSECKTLDQRARAKARARAEAVPDIALIA